MACTPVGFKSNACRLQGGIRAIYFGLSSDANYALDYDGTTKELTDMGLVNLYKFSPTNNQGTAVEATTREAIVTYAQTITATARGLDSTAIKAIEFLSEAEVFATVHFNSGVARLYGADFFLLSSGGESTSGESSGDSNTFSITLSGVEGKPAPLLQGATLDDAFVGMTQQPTINQ